MERTILPKQMQALEQAWMQETNAPSALLMEHAAQGVCNALKRLIPGGRALFLCGPGNNGGDGYAAARLWQTSGGSSLVMALSDKTHGDASLNRMLAMQCGCTLLPASIPLPPCDAIVDALFGTGFSKDIDGMPAQLIDACNACGKPIIAVDIPSGLDGADGTPCGHVIHATETVTFHRIKQGMLTENGALVCGSITVHPILIPAEYGVQEGFLSMTPMDLQCMPPRAVNGHKGVFGRVVLLVGSPGMAGAAAFCANACLRSGAGLVTLVCRSTILSTVQQLAPSATCIPLPEKDGCLTEEAPRLLATALAHANAAAVGCGLGQAPDVLPLLTVISRASCPVVWDADALNLLSTHPLPLPADAVITPHLGEAARLLSTSVDVVAADTLTALHALQKQYGCSVLLKGTRTLMTDGQAVAVNRFGSPALAKGGSGDILTGILSALLARRDMTASTLTRMQAAALIHGMAGMRAADAIGVDSVLPDDVLKWICLHPNT